MANRLSKIYTRTGDNGTTGLGDGTRVAKDSLRVIAMGDVDELNSVIGLMLCVAIPERVAAVLVQIQHDLFNLGGEICMPKTETKSFALIKAERVTALETILRDTHHAAGKSMGLPFRTSHQRRRIPVEPAAHQDR